ncbi:MAG TPA: hypothetical protein EYO33_21340 [Phycisphaerales bacterium]|nr:hypothetical protein [Phycisphaerales bacterium]
MEGLSETHSVVKGVPLCSRAIEERRVGFSGTVGSTELSSLFCSRPLLVGPRHLVAVLHNDVVSVLGAGHFVEDLVIVAVHGCFDSGYGRAVSVRTLAPGRDQIAKALRIL